MNREFTTSLDLTAKILTFVALTVLLTTVVYSVWRLTTSDTTGIPSFVHVAIIVIMISVLAGTWTFRVVGYVLEREYLIIRRPIGNRKFAVSDILKVIVPPTGTMRWSLRTFGNGGLFGFTGYYANTTFGAMRWFATRTNNYVILQMKDGAKIVITPDDINLASDIRVQAGLPAA